MAPEKLFPINRVLQFLCKTFFINIVLFLFSQSITATSYHGLIEKIDIKCDDHEMLSLFTDLVSRLKGAFSCFLLFCKYCSVFSWKSTSTL